MDEDAVPVGAPAARPRRSVRRRIVLSAATTIAGAGLAAVLISNAYASTPPAAPDPAETAVQSYTSPGGYDLRSPKRAKFAAFAAVEAPADDTDPMPSGPVAPAGVAQRYAAKAVANRGWSDQDFACLVKLWNRESGWNAHAASGSGAYGIPQAFPGSKMASAGGDWRNDHRVQIRWGLGYIAGRYGTPCKAWANSVATGSY